MSNGGVSNSPTGATGDKPTTAKIDSPIPKGPNAGPGGSYRPVTSEAPGGSYSSAASEAPGGKGGFPSAQSPYSQQPQVYMPPAQPTFYDQALNSPYSQSQFYRPQQQFYQPAPQYYQQQSQYYQPQYYQPQPQINSFGLGSLSGGMGNAYARRPQYSPPSPIEARPPMDEMRMGVMGGGEEYWRNKRGYGQVVGPVGQVMPGKGSVPEPMPERDPFEYRPSGPPPPQGMMVNPNYGKPGQDYYVSKKTSEATRGVASDNMNNPAYQQQLAASNMTDYQRLMQRQQAASQPQQNYDGGLGLNFKPSAPTDFEIAASLGFKDPHAARSMLTWANDPMADQVAKDRAEQSKAYLNSIGYGQAGFDASKYEVKRQPVSTGPRTGLGALLGGV